MPDAFQLVCASCRHQFRVDNYEPGQKYRCPKCSSMLATPSASEATVVASGGERPLPAEVHEAAKDPARRHGHFILAGELGRGGMGVVYRAWDEKLSRWVALKRLHCEGATAEDKARFQREAILAASLDHPNILVVHEVGEHDKDCFIVMKFVDGRTLDRAGLAGLATIVSAVRDACRGVGHAHKHGIVHRDLKPSNILVDQAGRVYVMDFGLAKSVIAATGITKSVGFLGTPAYMSPEQARGKLKDVDARSDVYSLGATLWSLLAGRAPHQAESLEETLIKVATQGVPSIRSVRPDLPEALETILSKAMSTDREKRHADANELAADLDAFLRGRVIADDEATLRREGSLALPASWDVGPWPFVAAMALTIALLWGLSEMAKPPPPAAPAGPTGPDPFAEAMQRGRKAMADQDWDDARAQFSAALVLRQGHPDAERLLAEVKARIAARDKDRPYLEAMAAAEQAVKDGDWEKAAEAFARALLLKDLDPAAVAGLARAKEMVAELQRTRRYQAAMAEAKTAEGTRKWEEAEAAYGRALDERTDDEAASKGLARVREMLGPAELRAAKRLAEQRKWRSAFEALQPLLAKGDPRARALADECVAGGSSLAWASVGETGSRLRSRIGATASTLSESKGVDGNPVWSPDGRRLAFHTNRDENTEIYTVGWDGGDLRRMTQHPFDDRLPSWSPDGRRIAYMSCAAENIYQVWVMDASAGGWRALSGRRGVESSPSWSPDGSRIAYTSDRLKPGAEGSLKVHVSALDGSGLKPLAANTTDELFPVWSRDGTRVAFLARNGDPRNSNIYVVDAGGGEAKCLTTSSGMHSAPVWSPDGSRIAFHTNRDGNFEIYVMNADGKDQRRLTVNTVSDLQPTWSPDGRKLAFSSHRDGNAEIYVVDLETMEETRVTNDPAADQEPAWSALRDE